MPTLIVKANHFKGSAFCSPCDCPLAKAAKEQFKVNRTNEGVFGITIDNKYYTHKDYSSDDFQKDLQIAELHNFSPDFIIRKIKLT